jgi:hypothetical protein
MKPPRKTITFAITDNPSDIFNADTDEITTEQNATENNKVIGTYDYQSEPRFGTQTTANGELYWDKTRGLIALTTYNDHPKPSVLFRTLENALDISIDAPTYPQEAAAQFFQTFGFNGYTTSFREDLTDYTLSSNPARYIKPESELQERAMHSNRDASDDWLEEITNEFLEDHYISSMDCMLQENGHIYTFQQPMQFTGIPDSEWTTELRDLIFQRMKELRDNEVPTTEDVID